MDCQALAVISRTAVVMECRAIAVFSWPAVVEDYRAPTINWRLAVVTDSVRILAAPTWREEAVLQPGGAAVIAAAWRLSEL